MNRIVLIVLLVASLAACAPPRRVGPPAPGNSARAEADLPTGGAAALYPTTWAMCRETLSSLKK